MNEKLNIFIQKIKDNKRAFFIGGISLVIIVVASNTMGYYSGKSAAAIPIEGKKMTYDELVEEIKKKEQISKDLQIDISEKYKEKESIIKEVQENQKTFDEAVEIIDNKIAILEEIKTLETQVGTKKGEIETLNSDIESKKSELASITGEIQKSGEEPIKLGAGYYYFGKDIPPGRYDLQPQQGQYGNVFIRGLNGRSKVADTFGRDELHSFIFEGIEGEEVEATIPIILVPVK
ncbi:hypothetical protein V7112_08765 [Bacillus sp. JJ1566]|uniref:hypothetical protein n=1 Tax=Bacillus sp. JJ1566 TaxID=3122961 RepID=UPI002FFED45E